MPKYVVAIDLGTTKVVSLVGEKLENEHYRIVAYSEAPSNGIRRGQVEQIFKVVDAIVPTLEKIKADAGLTELENVYVGIAGQHITCIENTSDRIRDKYDKIISQEEIMEITTTVGKMHINPELEILHIIPLYYSIDENNYITDPVGRLGNRLIGHFYIIIGNKSNSIHTNTCLNRLNLSLNKLILEPIASARAVLSDDEKELGVAMIDIGGGTTDLIIYKEHIIVHTAVIPFGGNSITEDIKTICSIPYDQAERIKIKFGLLAPPGTYVEVDGIHKRPKCTLSLDTIKKIISARLDEIISMVLFEIVNNKQCGKLGAGIVITGGVSEMQGIKEFLTKHLKYLTETDPEISKKLKPEVVISSPQYIYDSDDNIIHPKFSTAVGLVMCGFDHLADLELTEEHKRKLEEEKKRKEEERKKSDEKLTRADEERQRQEAERQRLEERKQKWKLLLSWIKKTINAISTFMSSQQEEKND
jgi:cell division protein FtsA